MAKSFLRGWHSSI